MIGRHFAEFTKILGQCILEGRLLIRLSLDEQVLWRKGRVEDALSLLRLKKEAIHSFRALDERRRDAQKELGRSLHRPELSASRCRANLKILQTQSTYLSLINRNTIRLVHKALQGHTQP